MNMNSITVGERIALLRKKNGYTQQQLADILSISSKTVSRWETGEGFPEISIIPNLAKTLDVSIDQLLEDTSNDYWENQYKLTLSEDSCEKKAIYISILITICCILIYQVSLITIILIESYVFSTDLCLIGAITTSIKILQLLLVIGCFFLTYKMTKKYSEKMLATCQHLPVICISLYIISEVCRKLLFYTSFSHFAAVDTEAEFDATYSIYTLGSNVLEFFTIVAIAVVIIFCVKNKKVTIACVVISIINIAIGIVIINGNNVNTFVPDNMLIKLYECLVIIVISFYLWYFKLKKIYQ